MKAASFPKDFSLNRLTSFSFFESDQKVLRETIPSGMDASQHLSNPHSVKTDLLPWMISLAILVTASFTSGSNLPAIVLGIAEMMFFGYNCLQASVLETPMEPEPVARDLDELWDMILSSSHCTRQFLSGWFYDSKFESITVEDVHSFLTWATFSTTYEVLDEDKKCSIHRIFVKIQEQLNYEFPTRLPSQQPLPCMRFTIEPLLYKHKPIVFYLVCQWLLGAAAGFQLRKEGFAKHVDGEISYWIRLPECEESRKKKPIVFVHGVGVGLITYLSFLKELMVNDCPMILIELPHISCTISPVVPSIDDHLYGIERIFQRWELQDAFWVGHSYGSVVLSWMVQHLPERVAGIGLIDPVVMMLNLKDVLYNFLYKKTQDNDRRKLGNKLGDLIGSELYLNNALRRNFWWYRNILWAQDLQKQNIPSLVCLSEHDEIVPSHAVHRHIEQHASRLGQHNCVRSYTMRNANHGQMLFDRDISRDLASRLSSVWREL
ncbi:hypothetical protein GUITHDRAFT_107873 [Guillardia theta CCMP2712]|uniref:AB hydrolase-1 domain-containing protein n=1 Tax=Guillardia theta (strain CCMP2712) TaxID=905079 RepID=L1JCK3_GUITC|nr:hypothetical protein GUITHDRAFT_107873 [Guillardia theta CCMP2712]EKX46261.1 hypothetical protein GUITHDRAFT_107873 [Guillardia theta CCMP2712]|eukprot:XP_005833241.1 hypothetical protein GUITHDRAFT_107873 [Guillardia theta CCMP2712]